MKKLGSLVWFIFLCFGFFNIQIYADDIEQPYEIVSIKAYLYYEQTNSFSIDIFSEPDISMWLWNTIIGEGFAESPSTSTMVVVEISGSPEAYNPERKIELIAYKGETVIFTRQAPTSILSEAGKYFQAFWLYDTGCEEIKLVAQIIGQSQVSVVEKIIPFCCGE